MALTPAQVARVLGIRPAPAKAQLKEPARAEPAPAPRTRPPGETGFDAMAASPEDIARRYNQLGLDSSGIERRLTPPQDPGDQRAARRAVDRVDRDRARAGEARASAVSAGAIDGRTATDDEVRERMQALGIDTTTVITRQERPLTPTAEDRAVATTVRKTILSGKHFDVTKLSAGERMALNELGNVGGYGAPGGGSGLGYRSKSRLLSDECVTQLSCR